MLFHSFEFVFLFLPIVFIGFFVIARGSAQLAAFWLALASMVFYGWLVPKFLLLLLASILFNYAMGLAISRMSNRTGAKFLLMFGVCANLSLLAFYKYAKLFLVTFNAVVGSDLPIPEIALPLGISFFTFTQIAFLVDVYRKEAHEYGFIHYVLFVTYFPHLIAGPILHHRHVMPQFSSREAYRLDLNNVAQGLSIFTIGLVKKILVADNFANYANTVFDAANHNVQMTFGAAWVGVVAYALQLYFDFSGYCDMAIGISRLFGIQLPLNFNSPYKAKSIIEFWRRWHMTLSQFLQQYLYIPLGGNRKGKSRRYLNLMITMLLGGLWHGANWTFVVWGGLHGAFLIVNHAWRALVGDGRPFKYISPGMYDALRTLLTFLCVTIAWIVFRANSLAAAFIVLKACFGATGDYLPFPDISLGLMSVSYLEALMAGLIVVWFAPNTQEIMGYANTDASMDRKVAFAWRPSPIVGIVYGIFFILAVSSLNRVSPFLYYQF
jgi:alginate O-acetyltransferase complex protein AlgI